MKIAACADIHIGRVPSFLTDKKGSYSWDLLVDAVIKNHYEILLIAGDVIDQEKTFLNNYGPLKTGLKRLEEAAVEVVAVTGNHDCEVFSKLASEMDAKNLTVLGSGSSFTYKDIGPYRFIGWSFTSNHYTKNPLENFDSSLIDDQKINIGLLHCEKQNYSKPSLYAPVLESELEATGLDLWVLGHIHFPLFEKKTLYCGSVCPLDTSEIKALHGLWEIDENLRPRQKLVSPWLAKTIEIKLEEDFDKESQIVHSIEKQRDKDLASFENVNELFYQIKLCGTSNQNLDLSDINVENVKILGIEDLTEPALSLSELKTRGGLIGILASLLEKDLTNELSDCIKTQNYYPIKDLLTDDEKKKVIRQAALSLLRDMLAQEENHG